MKFEIDWAGIDLNNPKIDHYLENITNDMKEMNKLRDMVNSNKTEFEYEEKMEILENIEECENECRAFIEMLQRMIAMRSITE